MAERIVGKEKERACEMDLNIGTLRRMRWMLDRNQQAPNVEVLRLPANSYSYQTSQADAQANAQTIAGSLIQR